VHLDEAEARSRAAAADHGVLATINRTGAPDLVPVCFAIDGEWVAIPIDSVKPKGSTTLGRVRNLERDPRATLLVEHWDAVDWARLWWVRASLVRTDVSGAVAERLVDGLRRRYPQYAGVQFDAVLTFRIEKIGGWEAAGQVSSEVSSEVSR
jgi:PPOX class probable F420-dependent enzyme